MDTEACCTGAIGVADDGGVGTAVCNVEEVGSEGGGGGRALVDTEVIGGGGLRLELALAALEERDVEATAADEVDVCFLDCTSVLDCLLAELIVELGRWVSGCCC